MLKTRNYRWMSWPGDSCPECGDDIEILTESRQDGVAYDGDKVRCVTCGYNKGYLSVIDIDSCYINWIEH